MVPAGGTRRLLVDGRQLLEPTAVAVDANGVLFVSDTGNHRIRKLVSR